MGKRTVGALAALALALWPVHARLSPVDGAAPLIALLLASSIALVLASERFDSAWLLVCAWLSVVLAATARPEPILSVAPLCALVFLSPKTRRLQLRPGPTAAALLLFVPTAANLYVTISAELGHFSPTESLGIGYLARLAGPSSTSILFPPRTPLPIGLAALFGFGVAAYHCRGKTVLWYLVMLFPAIPTASVAGPDAVTARYQLPLIPVFAVFLACGVVFLFEEMKKRSDRVARVAAPLGGVAVLGLMVFPFVAPPPTPTFKLEYAFFRENIKHVPRHCTIVEARWRGDLGLATPTHIPALQGAAFQWTDASPNLPVENRCYVFWKAASCHAQSKRRRRFASRIAGLRPVPNDRAAPVWRVPMLRSCELIRDNYRLNPVVQTRLPAITGYREEYTVDPVPVGFYRLVPKNTGLPDSTPR